MIGCDNCGVLIPERICPVCGHQHGPFADSGILDLGLVRTWDTLGRNNYALFFEEFVKLLDTEESRV